MYHNLLKAPDLPENYFSANDAFLKAAEIAGAEIDTIELKAKGPNEQSLFLVVARIGSLNAEVKKVSITGVHGIEAFTASRAQEVILLGRPEPKENTANYYFHVIAPHAMSNLRRVEEGVDLNRNFLLDKEHFKFRNEAYSELMGFLNPGSLSNIPFLNLQDSCYIEIPYQILKAGKLNIKEGIEKIKRALTLGQYEHEKGLYYGGKELHENNKILRDYFIQHFSNAKKIVGHELHTGLGNKGQSSLFISAGSNTNLVNTFLDGLDTLYNIEIEGSGDQELGIETRGAICDGITSLFGNSASILWVTHEVGTYNIFKVFKALRAENLRHYQGADLNDFSKVDLKEVFCMKDEDWQMGAIRDYLSIYDKLISI